MDDRLLEVARAPRRASCPTTKGWRSTTPGSRRGDGSVRCSRSAPTAGSRPSTWARRRAQAGTVLFTVDHHRGSEENQAGWEHHDPEVVDPETGRMDTLPFFRRTIEAAGSRGRRGRRRRRLGAGRRASGTTPLGFLFIDGGHAEDVAMADYATLGAARRRRAACSRSTTCSRTRPTGGQAPFHVWQRAVADGFAPVSTTGSLRVLRNETSSPPSR